MRRSSLKAKQRDDVPPDLMQFVEALAKYQGSSDIGHCDCDYDAMTVCSFCHESYWVEEHTPDCIVLKARKVLRG